MTREELVAKIGLTLCQGVLAGKICPCVESGEFRCFDGHPGTQAQAAIKAIEDAGFMVAPVEPCHDMTGAVLKPGEDRRQLVKDYKTMLKASPMSKK